MGTGVKETKGVMVPGRERSPVTHTAEGSGRIRPTGFGYMGKDSSGGNGSKEGFSRIRGMEIVPSSFKPSTAPKLLHLC